MLDEKQIPETVFKMASSTFVAEVEASTLAIMAPRLDEGSPYFHTSSKSGHVAEMCNYKGLGLGTQLLVLLRRLEPCTFPSDN